MATRRAFISTIGAASAAAVTFQDHAVDVVEAASAAAGGATGPEPATEGDPDERKKKKSIQ